ncbi:hypothetical protein DB88DRAFT_108041 [Papiliotrema laurentii]|uniref:DUF6534 domain-containing protein n=1 Tax=Papiliotrema laurentii TaxID=5418 RepID=A0AAD9FLJ3_PAPLA|nr:hypothetical protein DB88DRAFT_108041 [Papiliotrema laurentii]
MLFDCIFFGIMAHQAILWASTFRTERLFIKIVVLWTVLVSTIRTGYNIWFLWYAFVQNFGIWRHWADSRKFMWEAVMDILIIPPVQVFYLERAYRLNRERKWIPMVILPIIALAIAGAIRTCVIQYNSEAQDLGPRLRKALPIWLVPTAVADILLTGLIIFGLVNSRTGWSATDRLVNRLIRTSFESQLPGTVLAIVYVIFYEIHYLNPWASAFWHLVISKVYVVCLLAVLNYRYTLRKVLDGSDLDTRHRTNSHNLSNRHHQETMQMDKIRVDTVVYEEAHESLEQNPGLNRQRLPDEESGHSSGCVKEDEFSSSTRLHHQTFSPVAK